MKNSPTKEPNPPRPDEERLSVGGYSALLQVEARYRAAEREAEAKHRAAEREAEAKHRAMEREADAKHHAAEREADLKYREAEREADLKYREAERELRSRSRRELIQLGMQISMFVGANALVAAGVFELVPLNPYTLSIAGALFTAATGLAWPRISERMRITAQAQG